MLRSILGPVFNMYLDQFLTYKMCYLFLFFWAETPNFIVFSAKMQKIKKHKKEKKTLSVNTIVLTALVKMSVFFCIFHFCCLCNSMFSEMFLKSFQKSKHNKIGKQEEQKTTTRKQDAKQKEL